jgi:hypothetical protein
MVNQLAELKQLGVIDLRTRYAQVFGEETRAGNKAWLVKPIAWRMQAQAEGDLSQRARQRAAQLANDADLRLSPPRASESPTALAMLSQQIDSHVINVTVDNRLPPPGTIITRAHKGQTVQVMVLEKGFEIKAASLSRSRPLLRR